MSQLLFDKPGLLTFWSAYDPLDLASDSIDPLGFMAGYVALADRILPGFTTITTVPRYASMLCLALKMAREELGDGQGESTSVRRKLIIEKLKTFERAWGLACGLAEEEPTIGVKATDGLRGIRAVHRWLELYAGKEKVPLSFSLLSNQVRYGGIGAYSTFLESLHLADMATLSLRPLGEELASSFPSPLQYGLNAIDDKARLPVAALRDWGCEAHAGALTTPEAQLMRRALQGGEEAEFDDQTRWTMLKLLRACDREEVSDESHLLSACLGALKQKRSTSSDAVGRAESRIAAALRVIGPYEHFYQTVVFIFDSMRLHANASGQTHLNQVMADNATNDTCSHLKKAAAALISEAAAASSDEAGLGSASSALAKLGLLDLARTLCACEQSSQIAQEILQRHKRVQEGKFDGGLPKAPWIRSDPGNANVVRLTAQRFGLEASEAKESWRTTARHPYRTSGARRFIRLCRIQ